MTIEPPASTTARPRRLGGRYALLNQIGAGGMGSVYLGRLVAAAGFERIVAVKRMNANSVADPQTLAMFQQEMRLSARIRHPNVPAALDVVEDEGELWLVMEYIHGASLPLLLNNLGGDRGLPPRIAAAVCVGVLSGLHAAHEATDSMGQPLNIVHRDVSPQNVLIGRDGLARIINFGVARAVGQSGNTTVGQIKGKLAYLAPERLTGLELDRRADVYGASIVLWEMLTGRKLFETNARADVIERVISAHVVPPSSIVPELSPELEAIVLRGLHKEPAHRFQTARDMSNALRSNCDVASPDDVAEWMAATAGWWLEQRDRDLLAADALTFTPNALELQAAAAGTRRNARPEFNEQTVIAPIRPIRAELEPLEPTNSTRPLVQPRFEPRAESKPSAGAKSILRRAFKTTNALNIARRGALVLTTCILVGLFAGSQLGNAASDRSRQPAVRHPAAIASAQRVLLAPAESEPSKPAPSATSVATPSGVVEVVQVSPVLGASSAAPSSSPLASAGNVTGGNPHPVGRPVAVKPSARSSWVVRKTTKAGPDGF